MKMSIGWKLVPVILIILFVLLMTTGTLLKKPISSDDDVQHYITITKKSIRDGSWKTASANIKKSQSAWKKVKKRIQFSVERDEMSRLGKSLTRANSFIKTQEKASALAELDESLYIWSQLGK